MPELHQLLLFIGAGILLNLTPGPDVLYIVSTSLRSGAKAGVVAALGINAGCFVHVFAAALGVSALLAASAAAFTVLKWVGAAYLFWVGIKLLVSQSASWAPPPAHDGGRGAAARPTLRGVFMGGFLTNVLNPKVAIFFLAFVPQFIAPDAEHKAMTFIALGALFNVNSVFVNAGWAVAAAWMAGRRSVQAGMHWLDRAAGAMFVAFGLKLALSDNPNP
jgi:RhtB (resistance to homoserine/threonine) family protein